MNVVNTVKKNSIIKAIMNIKKKRMEAGAGDENTIELTAEYMGMLNGFTTIVSEDRVHGLGGLVTI